MIHGLGLFAALGTPESEPAPQPPAGDPALFAAALVAALGLKQAVEIVEPVEAPVVEQEPAEGEQRTAEGEAPAGSTEQGEAAPLIVARVTPDAAAIEEAETLGTLLRATPRKSEQLKGRQVDRVINEPAAPAAPAPGQGVAQQDAPVAPAIVASELPSREVGSAERFEKKRALLIDPDALEQREMPVAEVTATVKPQVMPADAPAPVIETQAPVVVPPGIVTPAPQAVTAPTLAGTDAEPSRPRPMAVPPQSNEERTARAIAENTRVGRQLAEILGEDKVTEFTLELAPRRLGKAAADGTVSPTVLDGEEEQGAPVVWQRAVPGEAPGLPVRPGMRQARKPVAPEGTLARESAPAESLIQKGGSERISFSGLTGRSEIVRMVATASRAMSPHLTEAEASPAVAKAPAASVTPSLPVVRQELPAAAPRIAEPSGELPKRQAAREAAANDASAANATASANYSASAAPRGDRAEARDVREARNLPMHAPGDEEAAGPADRVTLQVADDEGRQTRIRVSVSGNQLRAVITPPDSASARQLEQRMDQLHETLVRQGFADPKVVVRSAPESGSEVATLATAAGSQDSRNAAPAGREQPAGEQRQGRQREQDRGDGHRHPQGHSRERDPRDRRR